MSTTHNRNTSENIMEVHDRNEQVKMNGKSKDQNYRLSE